MTIKIGSTNDYTIPGSTKLKIKDAITFTQDGRVVASVDAIYDVKDLPSELHHLFLQLVQQSCHNLVLPSANYKPPPPKPTPWYRKLFSRKDRG